MATKISQLTAASSIVDGAELVPIVQSSTTKRTTLQIIADWVVKTSLSFTQSGTAPASRTVQAKGREVEFSLMDKSGAVADGVTDLTTQWANLIADANAQVSAAVLSGYPISTFKVTIPAGDYYIATGATAANLNIVLEGKGNANTRIRIGAGQYLLTVTNVIYQLGLRGISFSGGKGVLAHTFTGTNVQGISFVEDCNFNDYTECAIGSLAPDFPYWKIRRNVFQGAAALASKGIVLMGTDDTCEIAENAFLRNRYHLKLGNSGHQAKIRANDFIRFTNGGGAPVLTDIWIIPATAAVLSGQGSVYTFNKFGNENINAADFRILLADEAAGTNALDKNHATTASTGFWSGARFLANVWVGAGTPSNGIIYSYTPNVRDLRFDDYLQASQYPNIIQFDASILPLSDDRTSASSQIKVNQETPFEVIENAFSNAPSVALLDDPFGLHQGRDYNIQRFPKGFDPSYTAIGLTAINSAGGGGFTVAAATDSIGGSDAATVTFSASGESAAAALTLTMGNLTIGRMVWVEFDVKVAASLPLTQIDAWIGVGGTRAMRLYLPVPSQWTTIRMPWIPRQTGTQLYVQFSPGDYSAGVKTKVLIGRVRAYHSPEPQHFGARYLEASATLAPANLAAGATGKTTITVTGAVVGDFVSGVSHSAVTPAGYDDADWQGTVTAADTVTVRYRNSNAGAVQIASGTLRVRVQKKDS